MSHRGGTVSKSRSRRDTNGTESAAARHVSIAAAEGVTAPRPGPPPSMGSTLRSRGGSKSAPKLKARADRNANGRPPSMTPRRPSWQGGAGWPESIRNLICCCLALDVTDTGPTATHLIKVAQHSVPLLFSYFFFTHSVFPLPFALAFFFPLCTLFLSAPPTADSDPIWGGAAFRAAPFPVSVASRAARAASAAGRNLPRIQGNKRRPANQPQKGVSGVARYQGRAGGPPPPH